MSAWLQRCLLFVLIEMLHVLLDGADVGSSGGRLGAGQERSVPSIPPGGLLLLSDLVFQYLLDNMSTACLEGYD